MLAVQLSPADKEHALDLTGFVNIREVDFVGQGAYGRVYQGVWTKIPSYIATASPPDIAIKVIQVMHVNDKARCLRLFKSLRRELTVWKRLNHENILPLLGIASLDEKYRFPSLVSLWMPSGSVMGYLEVNPDADRHEICYEIATGLQYLHNQTPPVIHGDMKPDNILVDASGRIKICDFGLSRVSEDASIWATSTTGVGGTARWLAPEILLGEQTVASAEADIYAYGITCFQIVTGVIPVL